ncbi:MAG: cohesin domain-containing protein [Candidatus Poribacteria bacterium]|nr:cohesin domain-containing protein [Candidatus Poribacteria bacterium]
MSLVNGKYNFVYTFGFCAILYLIFPFTTVGQTTNNPNDSTKLSFSIDKIPIRVGDTFTLHLNAENITDLAGWNCSILFDADVLEAVEVLEGDFLKKDGEDPFFLPGEIDNAAGKITNLSAARFSPQGVSGTGSLLSVTFIAKTTGKAQVTLSNLSVGLSDLTTISLSIPEIVVTVEDQPDPDGPKFFFSVDETSIRVGDTFTLHLNAENITDLAGWNCNILFDADVLETVEVIEGDFLKEGGEDPFFYGGEIDNTIGNITKLSAALFSGSVSGTGRLLSVTFTVKTKGQTRITLNNLHAGNSALSTIPLSTPEIIITVEDQPIPDVDNAKLSFSIDEIPVRARDTFKLHLDTENVADLARWQCDIVFDPNVFEAVEVVEGDFLKEDGETTVFLKNTIDNTAGKITGLGAISLSKDGISGTGRLLSVTFVAKAVGEAQITLSNLYADSSEAVTIPLNVPEIVITVLDADSANLFFFLDETPVRAGGTFTLHLKVENVTDLAGWLCDIVFDPNTLEAIEVSEGDFLKKDDAKTFFLKGAIDNTAGKITGLGVVSLSKDGVSGTGRLLSVVFVAKAVGEAQITLTNQYAGSSDLEVIPLSISEFVITVEERVYPPWDVNQDGAVNILDLMHVAQYLREDASVNPQSDVDGDGTIGILDLIVVAQQIEETTASAPTSIRNRVVNMDSFVDGTQELTPTTIQTWIAHAQIENDGSIAFQKGIANLQRLLTLLTPKRTALLANYPNPFNPETWIPYQLSKSAEVSLTIYAANGKMIKTLVLGYQDAGVYKSRIHAAYWDGRNSIGEPVASGIYFYTLIAGDFTATRKMLIRK